LNCLNLINSIELPQSNRLDWITSIESTQSNRLKLETTSIFLYYLFQIWSLPHLFDHTKNKNIENIVKKFVFIEKLSWLMQIDRINHSLTNTSAIKFTQLDRFNQINSNMLGKGVNWLDRSNMTKSTQWNQIRWEKASIESTRSNWIRQVNQMDLIELNTLGKGCQFTRLSGLDRINQINSNMLGKGVNWLDRSYKIKLIKSTWWNQIRWEKASIKWTRSNWIHWEKGVNWLDWVDWIESIPMRSNWLNQIRPE